MYRYTDIQIYIVYYNMPLNFYNRLLVVDFRGQKTDKAEEEERRNTI